MDLGGAALGLQASLTVFSKLVMGSEEGGKNDGGSSVQNGEHDELAQAARGRETLDATALSRRFRLSSAVPAGRTAADADRVPGTPPVPVKDLAPCAAYDELGIPSQVRPSADDPPLKCFYTRCQGLESDFHTHHSRRCTDPRRRYLYFSGIPSLQAWRLRADKAGDWPWSGDLGMLIMHTYNQD